MFRACAEKGAKRCAKVVQGGKGEGGEAQGVGERGKD